MTLMILPMAAISLFTAARFDGGFMNLTVKPVAPVERSWGLEAQQYFPRIEDDGAICFQAVRPDGGVGQGLCTATLDSPEVSGLAFQIGSASSEPPVAIKVFPWIFAGTFIVALLVMLAALPTRIRNARLSGDKIVWFRFRLNRQ